MNHTSPVKWGILTQRNEWPKSKILTSGYPSNAHIAMGGIEEGEVEGADSVLRTG